MLQQAAGINMPFDSSYEHQEYVLSLREGTIDAWSGVILAMRGKPQTLTSYVGPIFQLIRVIQHETADNSSRYDGLVRSSLGVIGYVMCCSLIHVVSNAVSDISDTFPQGEFAEAFRQPWVQAFIKQARQNPQYETRTHDTARWAKEQVKKQSGLRTFPAS